MKPIHLIAGVTVAVVAGAAYMLTRRTASASLAPAGTKTQVVVKPAPKPTSSAAAQASQSATWGTTILGYAKDVGTSWVKSQIAPPPPSVSQIGSLLG